MQPDSTLSAKTYRFGIFEVDLRSGEVRKAGTRIRIQGQPFEVLAILLTQPGEVVTREELQKRLWPTDIFVDFDHGVNTAINKLRVALSDTADTPRYIETLPRRGYRFIAPVVCEEAAQTLRKADSGSAAPAKTAQVVPLPVSSEPDNGSQQTLVVDATKQHRIGLTVRLPILFLMLATAGYGVYSILNMKRTGPFETFAITQATNRQGTVAAAISPDGKYLLSVLDEHGKQSLWLRHLQTNSDTQVIAPSNTLYGSLEFSPDGSYFYFRNATDNTGTTWNLLRAPVLGGAPQLITRDVDTAATFSPDGRRIAFMRSNDPEVGKFQVIVAHADGTPDDRIFAEGPSPEAPIAVAWSPDGKQIASTLPGSGDLLGAIQFQDVASAKVRRHFAINKVLSTDQVWLPGGQGLLITYANSLAPFAPVQIGFLSSDAARFRAITNDTNSYQTLTLSADGKTLATVQQTATRSLYLLPPAGFNGIPPNPAPAQHRDSLLFGWSANGSLYFDDNSDLLQMSPDGTERTTVLSDPTAAVLGVSGCPDGRYVILAWAGRGASNNNKVNIWRANADGSNPVQLTHGSADVAPICARGGQWVYYKDVIGLQIMRVHLDGGLPEVVPGTVLPGKIFVGTEMGISPDNRRLAFLATGTAQNDPDDKIALVPLDEGPRPSVQLLVPDPRVTASPQFSPDGGSLIYPIRESGAENLWQQPLIASPGRQITNFQSDGIQFFQFSPDGKTLGMLRAHIESYVVLLHDTGASPR
jgi:DNA-binding winged helix-turn-helix (wHTH) protein/Tol biopolymer transport system component